MTITITSPVLIYWTIAFNFEVVYIFFMWRRYKKKAQQHPYFPMVMSYYEGSPTFRSAIKKMVSPYTAIVGLVLLLFVSPFMFPFSLVQILQEAIGYKSKLEKEADAEQAEQAEIAKKAQEFMKHEGRFAEEVVPNESEAIEITEKTDETK